MCLITDVPKTVTTEDLIVYKLVKVIDGEIFSICQDFKWQINELVKAEFSFQNPDTDIVVSEPAFGFPFQFTSFDRASITDLATEFKYFSVAEGLHFAFEVDRIFSCFMGEIHRKFAKCIVPAGSELYVDHSGLGVSNQIILKEILSGNGF